MTLPPSALPESSAFRTFLDSRAAAARIEAALERAVFRAAGDDCPPQLGEALRYSIFPGGARLRPRLCLAVNESCHGDDPELAEAAAAALEMLHCASLIHDDMPAFDNADTRRGRPTTHLVYGEDTALLVGDGLIVQAFEELAVASGRHPERLPAS